MYLLIVRAAVVRLENPLELPTLKLSSGKKSKTIVLFYLVSISIHEFLVEFLDVSAEFIE